MGGQVVGDGGRDGSEIERGADEITQGHDQRVGVHAAPGDESGNRLPRQPHLFFGPQKQDIRQRTFHRIANAAGAV